MNIKWQILDTGFKTTEFQGTYKSISFRFLTLRSIDLFLFLFRFYFLFTLQESQILNIALAVEENFRRDMSTVSNIASSFLKARIPKWENSLATLDIWRAIFYR